MKIFEQQLWHFILLALLLIGVFYIVQTDEGFVKGELAGLSTRTWMMLAILSAVLHQIYVLISWRAELYYQSISKAFGSKGYTLFKVFFAFLILSRPISIILLAFSNAYSLTVNPLSIYILAGILLIPTVYLFYSLRKYFGIDRAFGIDHFFPEKYRDVPMVKRGIFKYTSNAMYVFGFFILWIPGILLQSKAALLVALFQHLYIWVHYYCTELPDIKHIYTNKKG